MKKITIRDVAAAAGVSTATVSRVVNHLDNVLPEARRKVEDAIETLGYESPAAVKMNRAGKSGFLGVLLPNLKLEIFTDLLNGVLHEADVLQYSVITMTSEGDTQKEKECLRRMAEMPIEGLLFRPVSGVRSFDDARRLIHKPIVGLSSPDGFTALPTLHAFDQESGYIAARYLLRIGRRRILFCAGFREEIPSGIEELDQMAADKVLNVAVGRYLGYRRALAEADIAFDPKLVNLGRYTREGGQAAASCAISLDQPADAIVAANDEAAVGAILFLRQQGIRVPEQISIIGFDNSRICSASFPTITSVDYDVERKGRIAVQMMNAILHNEDFDSNGCEPKLVIRGSTCAL